MEDWLAGARRVDTIEIDVWLRVEPALYVGPESGSTPDQWRTLREPIGVALPSEDGWLSASSALEHTDALAEHYRRTLAIGNGTDA